MRRCSITRFAVILFFILLSIGTIAQEVERQTEVRLSAFVDSRRVPLNRTLGFIVQISWEGDLDLIEIGEIEEPIMTNLDVTGTSSANRITGTAGGQKAVKEVAYTLQPTTLGMAYIEPVGLEYEDKRTGKTHALMTQRIGVEVVSPIPERNGGPPVWVWIIGGGVLVLGGGAFFLLRHRSGREGEEEEPSRTIEEIALEELRLTVDLKGMDKREAFSALTRLFRRYLSEKYSIPALEATTAELLNTLEAEGVDEGLRGKCEKLFEKADVVKFSGQAASQADLEEAYTTVETILEMHLREIKEKMLANGEIAGKSKRLKHPGGRSKRTINRSDEED